MAETGIVNLSLKIEDIQEFIDGFKKMGETVSAVTTEVSKGMTDISQYLRQCTEGFNALSKSLTDITNNMSKFSFDNLKNQIDDFTVFAESLAKATSGTSNLQQQTAQFAQTFGSADLARQTREIQQAIADLQIPQLFLTQTKELKQSFEQIAQSLTSQLEPKLNEMINLLKQISTNTLQTANETNQLNQQFTELSANLNRASESWARDNEHMKRTDSWLSRLTAGFRRFLGIREQVTTAQNEAGATANNETQTGQGSLGMFNNKTIKEGLNYVAWTAKRVFYFGIINGVMDAFKDIPNVGKQYEKTISNLSTSFGGNIAMAKAQFQELNNTINEIPQSFEEVTKATQTLRLFNFGTSQSDLVSLAKIAEGTGESFESLADAMGKFTEGNFNSLKRFGITAKDEGEKIALTFKGTTTEIQKDTESLQNYINNLANTEFATALDEQMNGLTGSYKRLQNAWGDLSLELYNSGVKEFLKDLTDRGSEYVQKFISWLKDPEIKANIQGILSMFSEMMDGTIEIIKTTIAVITPIWQGFVFAFKKMFDGIAIMFKAVANAFGADIDVINDDLADNVNHFHLWADTLIALFRTVVQSYLNLKMYLTGDAEQVLINKQVNIATKEILNSSEFDSLRKKIESKYGRNFIDQTFFAGDKTVMQDYAQSVNEEIDEIQNNLREFSGSQFKTKFYAPYIEKAKKDLVELKKTQLEIAKVMGDKRYQAPQTPYTATETNKFGSAMNMSETFYDNLRKAAEEREKRASDARQKAEKEQREMEEAFKKLGDGVNTPFSNKGGSGSGGSSKAVKEWDDFYNKMLAKITDYGKERVNLTQRYNENLKEIEKHYAEDQNISFEQYNNLKLELQKKYNKDMQDLIRNQNEAVARLFNSDYKNKLLDLEKANRERLRIIENSYRNGGISETERNMRNLESGKKYHEDLAKLQKQAEIEQNQLLDNEHANEIASLEQQYKKKLDLLKEYLDDERITHEQYDQGALRQKQYFEEQKRKLEESEFSASAGTISNAMSSFEKLDQTLRKYDLTFAEVLGTLSDKGKLTQKQNAMMWADMSNGMSQYFGAMSQNFEKGSGVYNALFALQKGFAIASATISMIQGAMEAWKLGFPAGLMAGMGVLAQGANLIGQLRSVQFRAKGGRLDPNALTVVGEQGAELITGVSGNVISNSKSRDLLQNVGGQSNVQVNLIEDASRAGQVNQRTDDDTQTIIDVIVSNIRNGGAVANAMSGTYGLARQGY